MLITFFEMVFGVFKASSLASVEVPYAIVGSIFKPEFFQYDVGVRADVRHLVHAVVKAI